MNRLKNETSPYLLQHAHNPVDWYAWKSEAFEKAKKEDKPILVSIGYSTCHWCHVMERESFENEDVAAFMNEHFVNIKVDREERPDVDAIYMEACQAISGQGGWPLNCFLTPEGKPFYAGTYFPPMPAYNRGSWIQVLQNIYRAFMSRRDEIEEQATRLTNLIQKSDTKFLNTIEGLEKEKIFTPFILDQIFHTLRGRFDETDGGFGGAPKFPGSMNLQFLMEYYFYTKDERARNHVMFSLDKMIYGGIYDQIGGGFSRYAVDKEWLVPHFEKMLYDNALLVSLMSDAYKLSGKELYRKTIEETLDFITREMTSEEGGFYSALDADSEGVEGKFYVWGKKEIEEVLGEDAEWFNEFYGVTENGNWEEKNILNRSHLGDDFQIPSQLEEAKAKLLKKRAERIRPSLDDKIILSWNALQCSAYAKAAAALQNKTYQRIAEKNANFLLEKFRQEDGISFFHTYKDGQTQYDAFLDDYAFLIEALLDVYEISFNTNFLEHAARLIEYVVDSFLDKKNNLFFFTSEKQQDIIIRKREVYDSATPSGNSTMVRNLQRLGILLDKNDYRELAIKMLLGMKESLEKYPTSFSRWSSALVHEVYPLHEVAIIGSTAITLAKTIQTKYLPNIIMMATVAENHNYPLLENKIPEKDTYIYVCQNYSCKRPVKTIEDFKKIILISN